MKASDITDERFLAAVEEAQRLRRPVLPTVTRWDLAAVLTGHPDLAAALTVREAL